MGNGYQAKLLTEDEAWKYLMPVARQAQKSFSSWQEMDENFLDGREIWHGDRDGDFDACHKLLANPKDPNSAWNQNPWGLDLTPDSTGKL